MSGLRGIYATASVALVLRRVNPAIRRAVVLGEEEMDHQADDNAGASFGPQPVETEWFL